MQQRFAHTHIPNAPALRSPRYAHARQRAPPDTDATDRRPCLLLHKSSVIHNARALHSCVNTRATAPCNRRAAVHVCASSGAHMRDGRGEQLKHYACFHFLQKCNYNRVFTLILHTALQRARHRQTTPRQTTTRSLTRAAAAHRHDGDGTRLCASHHRLYDNFNLARSHATHSASLRSRSVAVAARATTDHVHRTVPCDVLCCADRVDGR